MNVEHVKPAKILVIEDNPTSLRVLFDYLSLHEFTVLIAQDGGRAFKLLDKEHPDLILLDIMLPGMDGFDICRQLKARQQTKDIPVIFMTGLSDTEEKVRGFEAGGVDYITKPLHHEEVIARITTHLTIRKLQQQLQTQNQELAALNASKDTFFSIISHDLRTPFNTLLALTKLIDEHLDTYSQEKIRAHIKTMRTSAEKLYDFLENLLTWSRLQRGAIDYAPEPIYLQAIIARTVNLFGHTAEQKQITLQSSVPKEMRAYADHSMVDTIIRNLIANALKFTPVGGQIDVFAEEHENELIVSVADTGIGIAEEHVAKLFRIDAKHTTFGTQGEQGTGLGLSLCQEIVVRNGGRIWVESVVGTGSRFCFTLPTDPGKLKREM